MVIFVRVLVWHVIFPYRRLLVQIPIAWFYLFFKSHVHSFHACVLCLWWVNWKWGSCWLCLYILSGSEWVDPEDPTVIAETELLGAAASIEAAAKKLEQLKPRAKPKVSFHPSSESKHTHTAVISLPKQLCQITSTKGCGNVSFLFCIQGMWCFFCNFRTSRLQDVVFCICVAFCFGLLWLYLSCTLTIWYFEV